MPAVVTSDKVAIPGKMTALEPPTMEPSPVKSSTAVTPTTMAVAVGKCGWYDRQHSGKDQSENLRSAHYTTPFLPHSRAAPPGTIIGFGDALSAELMARGAFPETFSIAPELAWLSLAQRAQRTQRLVNPACPYTLI